MDFLIGSSIGIRVSSVLVKTQIVLCQIYLFVLFDDFNGNVGLCALDTIFGTKPFEDFTHLFLSTNSKATTSQST